MGELVDGRTEEMDGVRKLVRAERWTLWCRKWGREVVRFAGRDVLAATDFWVNSVPLVGRVHRGKIRGLVLDAVQRTTVGKRAARALRTSLRGLGEGRRVGEDVGDDGGPGIWWESEGVGLVEVKEPWKPRPRGRPRIYLDVDVPVWRLVVVVQKFPRRTQQAYYRGASPLTAEEFWVGKDRPDNARSLRVSGVDKEYLDIIRKRVKHLLGRPCWWQLGGSASKKVKPPDIGIMEAIGFGEDSHEG